ncbi:hypothetical protein [Aestuariivivens sp. NBU2969]|uniref:hypothetical protein n=1 Tax=Aestuariivivens sp. NBU2969 TaxID=2873267 RepID=UPI001CBE04ED|nr:hypothetical protein [Aestuariivivens sp. NBU2969]
MKKIFALSCLFIFFLSCSTDHDSTSYTLEIMPVESVDIPSEFELGKTYPITVKYYRPTTCYAFRDFYYVKENNMRTVAPINYVFEHEMENNSCTDLQDELVEATFNFIVTSNGSYIFKFWQGEDNTGEDQYLTIEVPVID